MSRGSSRTDARLLARAVRITVSAAPGAAIALQVLVVASSALPVASVWLSKVVVDRLATGHAAATAALAYGAILLAGSLVQPFERLLSAGIEEASVGEVDRRLMDAATRLVDLDRIERPAFHDELEIVRRAVQYIPRSILLVQQGFRLPLALVGVLALLVGLNPLLPLLLGVVTVAHVLAEQRMGMRRHDAMVRRSEAAREMDYCTRLATDPAAAKEVRVLGIGDFFLDRYRQRAGDAVAEMRSARLASLRTTALVAVAHAVVVGAGFVYVARRTGAGGLTPGDLALYLSAVVQAEFASWGLAFMFVHGHETLINLRVVLPFLDDARPAIALVAPGESRPVPEELTGGVALEDVRFRYPESDRDVLDGLTTHFPAGKVTAVVGANGAGKSTLVKLLSRMYDPSSGTITADGAPLAAYELGAWRSRLAAVHQDFARLSLTVAENISVGHEGAASAQIESAADWAGVEEIAARLPLGMDTPLTRRFEGGVELSGGEWQKVALARGALRPAALVLLDEPTAGLDPEAEYRLFQQFRRLVAGRTGLLISHRFSTVRMADNIVVLEHGRVLESGTHEQLVARDGRYAQLYEMQAGRYR